MSLVLPPNSMASREQDTVVCLVHVAPSFPTCLDEESYVCHGVWTMVEEELTTMIILSKKLECSPCLFRDTASQSRLSTVAMRALPQTLNGDSFVCAVDAVTPSFGSLEA